MLSLVGGKRLRSVNSAGPGQICYSNPKTVKWFWNKFEKYAAADRKGREKWQYPFIYSLKTNDNRNECQCTGCQALVKKYGWSGAKLYFVNQIAEKAAKKYHVLALYQLGVCHWRGYGVAPDRKAAEKYLKESMRYGYPDAGVLLALIQLKEHGDPWFPYGTGGCVRGI